MSIDYAGFRFSKGTPRAVVKRAKQRDLAREERNCRKKVHARDKHRCFYPGCSARATELHHILPRSVRGKTVWRTDDLISACARHHSYFKARLIGIAGNPDRGPVHVVVTRLGQAAGIRVPLRHPRIEE